MQVTPSKPLPVSQHFPPMQREALVLAAARRDWRDIDRITEQLVALGLCRPRTDDSMPLRVNHRGVAA